MRQQDLSSVPATTKNRAFVSYLGCRIQGGKFRGCEVQGLGSESTRRVNCSKCYVHLGFRVKVSGLGLKA